MNHVAEIASTAAHISAKALAFAMQEAQISVLKENINTEALIQEQLSNMINEMLPHLGNALNIAI